MKKLLDAVDKHRQLILDAERYIWNNPETGYREYKTTAYLEEKFTELGYDLVKAEGITGFYTRIDTGRPGPELLILGEMDSVICSTHPECDKETGAVHSCGHHAQCAALLGIAAALKEPGALDGLSGAIRLCAVPAEELLELEFRSKLKAEGKIKYFGGKPEFLRRGMFDGVDLALMVHTAETYSVRYGSVGCIAKKIIYKGKAAHAGGAPWEGVNALYAAMNGMNAVNAIRETFKEPDQLRFHPIITKGGDIVNAIPATAEIETYIRGKTFKAITDVNKRINRALAGAAVSIGARLEIIDIPGYAPLNNSMDMIEVAKEAMAIALPDETFTVRPVYGTGCTDMGDLSAIMSAIHPYCPGGVGTGHGSDYYITDPEAACLGSAKLQLGMIKVLLSDGAERAKKIVADFVPEFASKDEYLAFLDTLDAAGEHVVYNDDGSVTVK